MAPTFYLWAHKLFFLKCGSVKDQLQSSKSLPENPMPLVNFEDGFQFRIALHCSVGRVSHLWSCSYTAEDMMNHNWLDLPISLSLDSISEGTCAILASWYFLLQKAVHGSCIWMAAPKWRGRESLSSADWHMCVSTHTQKRAKTKHRQDYYCESNSTLC